MEQDEFDQWQQAEAVNEVEKENGAMGQKLEEQSNKREELGYENHKQQQEGMAIELQDSINMQNQIVGSLEYSHSANLNTLQPNAIESGSLQNSFNFSLQQSWSMSHEHKPNHNMQEHNDTDDAHVPEQAIKEQAVSQQQSSLQQSSNQDGQVELGASTSVKQRQKEVKSTGIIQQLSNQQQVLNYKSNGFIQGKPSIDFNTHEQFTFPNIADSGKQNKGDAVDEAQADTIVNINSKAQQQSEKVKELQESRKQKDKEDENEDEWQVAEVAQNTQKMDSAQVQQQEQGQQIKNVAGESNVEDDDEFGDYEGTSDILPGQSMPSPNTQPLVSAELYEKAMQLVARLPNYNYMRASYFLQL